MYGGMSNSEHELEIRQGKRFAFGSNWACFLDLIDESRIKEAEQSLQAMLGVTDLSGKSFLDIGSGSGLFSLAARRLGANVYSFDFDPQSVACTKELKERYFSNDLDWHIEQGSVLNNSYMAGLGQFDVVYSWGVLHHTGAMWLAIEHALQRVAMGGQIFIAIYNDQGLWSRVWWIIKSIYNRMPSVLKRTYAYGIWYSIIGLNIFKYILKLRPMQAIGPLLKNKPRRGMSQKYDIIDWMGGFPFEFARFELLVDYMKARGFSLAQANPNNGIGCHELVLLRVGDSKI